jgi:hypothetical protein
MTVAMNMTQARQAIMAIVQQIVNDHQDYPLNVERDNRATVDVSKQEDPFLQVSIMHLDGGQAELGDNPNIRHDGQIQISAVVKAGAGTADAEALLDFVLPYFSMQALGPLQLQAAVPIKGRAHLGLWYQPAIVPFYYFSPAR